MSASDDKMLRVLAADALPLNDSEYEASGEDSEDDANREDSDDEPMGSSSSGSDNNASDDESKSLPEVVEYSPLQPAPSQSLSSFEHDTMNLLRSSSFLSYFNSTYRIDRPATPPATHEEEKSDNEKQE